MYNILSTDLGAENKVSALWEITDKCNLKCIHCYQGDNNNLLNINLDTEKANKILENLYKCGVNHIHFLGGEPLLYNNLVEVIHIARSKYDFSISINTNGTKLTADYFERLSAAGVENITVSMEGATPKINDAIRGSGTFTLVDKNIRDCVERKQVKNIQTQLGITVTLMDTNASEIPQIVKYCLENNLNSIRFVLAYEYGNYLVNKDSMGRDDRKILQSIDQSLNLYQSEIKNAHLIFITDFRLLPIEFLNRKYGELIYSDKSGLLCNGGKTYCVIDVHGNLHPCIATSKINPDAHWEISNMQESHNYISTYKKEIYQKLVLSPCSECGYFGKFCEPCPALLNNSEHIIQCEWAFEKLNERNKYIRTHKVQVSDKIDFDVRSDDEVIILNEDEQIIINSTIFDFINTLLSKKLIIDEQFKLKPYLNFSEEDKDLLVEFIDILLSRQLISLEE